MRGSGFRIGKIFGIQIRVDWSWLVIFALVTWNLTTVLGGLHGNWGPGLIWGLAVLGSLLFFASVLAHELAHSVYARSRGVPVTSIRLFLFGGVSNIQREPDSAGNEFAMAILGPATSLVIGVVLLAVVRLTGGTSLTGGLTAQQMIAGLGPLNTVLFWLGSINVILGVFNLVPGFPLDGGRVLRSILWGITKNLKLATRLASWVGQGVAWLMILAGIAMAFGVTIPLLGTGLLSGLWLAFIGWFLHNAAIQSYQQMVVHDALEGVSVTEVMRRNPPTVSPDQTVTSFVHDYIMQSDDHGFPVVENDELVGMATLQDVRSIQRDQWEMTRVRQIMTPADKLVTMSTKDDASRALDLLSTHDIRQIPVLSEGHLAGLLRRQDLIRWLQLRRGGSGARNQFGES